MDVEPTPTFLVLWDRTETERSRVPFPFVGSVWGPWDRVPDDGEWDALEPAMVESLDPPVKDVLEETRVESLPVHRLPEEPSVSEKTPMFARRVHRRTGSLHMVRGVRYPGTTRDPRLPLVSRFRRGRITTTGRPSTTLSHRPSRPPVTLDRSYSSVRPSTRSSAPHWLPDSYRSLSPVSSPAVTCHLLPVTPVSVVSGLDA